MGIPVTRLIFFRLSGIDPQFIRMSSTAAFHSQKPGVDARGRFVCRLCHSNFRVTCIHVDPERSLLFAGVSSGYATLYNLEQCTEIMKRLYIGIGELTENKQFLTFSHTHTHMMVDMDLESFRPRILK